MIIANPCTNCSHNKVCESFKLEVEKLIGVIKTLDFEAEKDNCFISVECKHKKNNDSFYITNPNISAQIQPLVNDYYNSATSTNNKV